MQAMLHRLWVTYRRPLAFLAKMLAVYGVWSLLYEGWLAPDGRLDQWLATNLAALSGRVLALVGWTAWWSERVIGVAGSVGVMVSDACNGLSTMGLFFGFVVAYPGRWTRRLLFVPLGLLAVYAANVARIAALAAMQPHWSAAFEALHSTSAGFFYLIVFALWVLWANVSGAGAGGSVLRRSAAEDPAAQDRTAA